MSILSEVRKQREEHSERPVAVLMHPIDIFKATVEAWQKEESRGHYAIPSRLTHIAGLEILRDFFTEEGRMRVVTVEEYESIAGERLKRWRQEAGL